MEILGIAIGEEETNVAIRIKVNANNENKD